MSAISDNQTRPGENEDDPELGEFTRLKCDVLAGHRARGKWRKETDRAFDFVASHQWSEEDKTLLQSQNRPPITFNRTAPIVNAVCGLEVNNRQSVIYLPREEGDVGVNETISAAAKWARDECNAEDEESEAFRDNVICGEGWTETRMDHEDDPEGQIVKERIDPLEMGVNAGACRANYKDARLIYRIRKMDPNDARALLDLPTELDNSAIHARWIDDNIIPADGGQGNKKDYPEETRAGVSGGGPFSNLAKTVTIIQVQYWQRERVHLVAQTGEQELQELSVEEFQKFQERTEALNAAEPDPNNHITYEAAAITKKVFYECFLLGDAMYGKRKMKMGMFQFRAMTGQRDRKLKCFYGMVRDMFDPQMWANKWLSQTMHILNSNAKGGLLAETDAFVNQREAEKNWADPTKIVWVKPGSLQKQKVKERQPAQMPQGLDSLMTFAISSIRDVTGVNLELLGQADREQAASLEAQRRQSAMTVLATLFDSLRRYRKLDGKLLLHFIWLLPDNKLIRIVEKGQYKYIPLVKDGDVEKYDVIIDEAPTSPDQKQFVWAITAQILQMGILPPAAVIELLKYSPYPESVVQEIRKALGLDGEIPPEQMKQKLAQAEQALQVMEQKLQEAMAGAKTAEDDRAVEMLKLEIEEYKAETQRLQAQWEARSKLAAALGAGTVASGGEGGGSVTDPNAAHRAAIVSGNVDLPDIDGGSRLQEGNEEIGLAQKVDNLTQMVAQLIQTLGGQGQPPAQEPVPPVSPEPAAEPAPETM